MRSLAVLITIENPDLQAVSAWSTSIAALTQNEIEVSPATADIGLGIASTVLDSAVSFAISPDHVTGLFTAVDTISMKATSAATSASPKPLAFALANMYRDELDDDGATSIQRKLRAVGTTNTSVLSVLDSMGAVLGGGLVAGQRSRSTLQTNYRAASQVMSSSQSQALMIPQTNLETVSGAVNSSVSPIMRTETSTNIPVKLSLMSMGLRLVGGNVRNGTSNPLRLMVTGVFPEELKFTLQHHQPEEFHACTNSSSAMVQWTSWCEKGVVNSSVFSCPGDVNVIIRCDGSEDYTALNTCPQTTRRPACVLIAAPKEMQCIAVNASTYATECLCRGVDTANMTSHRLHDLASSIAKGRRLQSSVSSVAIQVTSIAQFVSSDFASVMTSSSSFNSVQALEATLLVIETFAGLWLGMAAVIVGFEYLRCFYKSRVVRDKHLLFRSTAGLPSQGENLEIVIREYLGSFYPSVFADAPRMRRLYRELFYHHAYLQVLTLEYGFKKMVLALELLTNLTANMFLLAVFYDLQWPSDDGSCQANLSESSCLDRKSLINPSQALCGWTDRGGATTQPSLTPSPSNSPSPSSTSRRCVWLKPSFEATSLILISALVVLLSGPIYVVLNVIFNKILLAPTESETIEEEKQVKQRRKSVMSEVKVVAASAAAAAGAAANHRQNTGDNSDIERPAHVEQQQQQQQQQLKFEIEGGEKRHRSSTRQGTRIFTTSIKLDNSIASLSLQAQESATRLRLIADKPTQSTRAPSHKEESLDVKKFVEGLRGYECTLRGRDLARLRGQWPILRPAQEDAAVSTSGELCDIATEINAVEAESKEWIEELKAREPSFVGVKILDLFVRDLVGRKSRKAKIFGNQSTAFQKSTVVTWGVKCLTMTLLIVLNGYFVFSCMLYGRDKGIHWQHGWLIASMANLFVDVMIRRVNIVLIVHYLIPTFIFDTISIVRQTINSTAEKMCRAGVATADRSFSAPEYLFVSNRVAKAFPGTLESSLVLAYRSANVSADQAESWRKAGISSQRISSVFSSVTTALVNVLLIIGSQPIPLQSLMVSCINPLVVALMAFVGTFILHTRVLGIPIGFGIAFAIALLLLYWLHKRYDHYRHDRNAVRPDEVAPVTITSTANQHKRVAFAPSARIASHAAAAGMDAYVAPVDVENIRASEVAHVAAAAAEGGAAGAAEGGVAEELSGRVAVKEGAAEAVSEHISLSAGASSSGCCAGDSDPKDRITLSQEVNAQPSARNGEHSMEAPTHPAPEDAGGDAEMDEEMDDEQIPGMWTVEFSSVSENTYETKPQPLPGAALDKKAPAESVAAAPEEPEPYLRTLENANRLYDIGDVISVHPDDTICKGADWNHFGSDSDSDGNHLCYNLLEMFGVESVDELFDVDVEAAAIDYASDLDDN